jgi:hypothetical protein
LNSLARPQFTWTVPAENRIEVQTTTTPKEVRLWQATNPTARNFRLDVIGFAWQVSPLQDQGGGTYIAEVSNPPQGWRAFFVELIFDNETNVDYKFTTEVRVTPDYLPFACVPIDLSFFVERWLATCDKNNNFCNCTDMNYDELVNFFDFAILASHWLEGPP